MPLIPKNYTWQQKSNSCEDAADGDGPLSDIVLRVPFPGNRFQPDDIFTTEQFLKISRSPHYWELFLCHAIDPDASHCSILENEVVFELVKRDPTVRWEAVELDVPRAERASLKEHYLAQHRKRLEERDKQRAVEKDRKKKDEIHRQIERERSDRTAIDTLLEESKQRELKRMELAMVREYRPDPSKQLPTGRKSSPRIQRSAPAGPSVPAEAPQSPPAVRRSGTLEVTFSDRTFVTPKRESMEQAEQEWTRKQAAARRSVGFDDDELRPDERNPEWLKQRGDTFFQQKNFLAAISAYSAGIRLTKDYYALFLNRSAAHLALENYQRCAEDCSAALELLHPPVEANRKARVACLARRAAALVKLGFLQQGYDEMVAASRLDPAEASLRMEVDRLRRCLDEQTADEDSESDE
ncbi:dynein assembly factor 4, axonemal-like isoform X2 [Anopheles stephensi]|uniref:dynein assembly factor 4, axonemal-like isoform X2 n=1 Tax=Anopheles stephensi TaxID=30069 RepID=UPI00165874CE|nr:dynein assembly factor 4, axonemal-like isoform X2 [Anopheles stephensi]XP_035918258.1 dynein assembly factor 4, axonemal-like isoform X2 [Anopheles stephensi]